MKAKHNPPELIEESKKRAAQEAVKHVKDGYVIGLGSGSTAAYAILEIGKMIKQKEWHILGVPTSYQAFSLAVQCDVPITTLYEHQELDLTIDGVDEVDPHLDMIKGMGGALAREKIVAYASKENIIVADEAKLVKKLGVNHPVPLEALPFATSSIMSKLGKIGGKPILRHGAGKVGPVVTDNGNFIIDADFGPIDDPEVLNTRLKLIPGVIETGLFIEMANVVYVGSGRKVRKLQRKCR